LVIQDLVTEPNLITLEINFGKNNQNETLYRNKM